jgi:hypothetical protein
MAHRQKKFTHYVWEFLMLFLAVSCGFLTEISGAPGRAPKGKTIYDNYAGRPGE